MQYPQYKGTNIYRSVTEYLGKCLVANGYAPFDNGLWYRNQYKRYITFGTYLPNKPSDAVAWSIFCLISLSRSRHGRWLFLHDIAGNANVDQIGLQMIELSDDIYRHLDVAGIDLVDYSQVPAEVVESQGIHLMARRASQNPAVDDASFDLEKKKKDESRLKVWYLGYCGDAGATY